MNKLLKLLLCLVIFFIPLALTAQNRTSCTVYFDFNKYDIIPTAATSLDSIFNFIRSQPSIFTIELYGHCDSIGTNDYNDTLSVKRTDAVKNYLAAMGLQSNTITKEEGFGKRQPLNNNASAYERFLNRRVIVTLVRVEIPDVEIAIVEKIVEPEKKEVAKITEAAIEVPIEKTIADIVKDPKTKVGSKIRLRDLNFIGNRHVILPESIMVMFELLDAMEKNPDLEISIEGHICCRPGWQLDGIDEDLGTNNLSEMRAKTVYDYLIKNGISAERLSYKGLGPLYPLYAYPENSEAERTANRRVEIKIIKK